MGFLDQLRQQAGALQSQDRQDLAALDRNTALAEAACRGAFQYLVDLGRQLEVLKPGHPGRWEFDRRTAVGGLRHGEFRCDIRRKPLRGQEVTDHIVLKSWLRSGQVLNFRHDFLPEMERLEERVRCAGVACETEAQRHPDNGKLQAMSYRVTADIPVHALITPDHDRGVLRLEVRNLDPMLTVRGELGALEFGSARLDELARWWVGEPHRFTEGWAARQVTAPR
jgi:hypothetical protein